jgi:hypothetical protein
MWMAILVMLTGCASGPSTQVVVGKDGQSREVSTIQTTYLPKDTLLKATAVCQRLSFKPIEPQGYEGPGWMSFFSEKEWPMVVDAFSGVAYAQTAAGEMIDLSAVWQKDKNTTLTITSQMAPTQHVYLVDQIAKSLSPPGK